MIPKEGKILVVDAIKGTSSGCIPGNLLLFSFPSYFFNQKKKYDGRQEKQCPPKSCLYSSTRLAFNTYGGAVYARCPLGQVCSLVDCFHLIRGKNDKCTRHIARDGDRKKN